MGSFFYLCIILCAFAVISSILHTKSIVNPIIPICLIWLFVIINAGFLKKLTPATNDTYVLLFIGLLSYVVGVFIAPKNYFLTHLFRKQLLIIKKRMLRKKLIYFLIFLML